MRGPAPELVVGLGADVRTLLAERLDASEPTKAQLRAASRIRRLVEDLPKSDREQVWGATLPLPKGGTEGRDLADRFGRAFDGLVARLNGLLLERLQDEADPERRAQIFAFQSSTTIACRSPAFAISIMSSSSSASGTSTMFTGGLPAARSRALSAVRLS